VLCAVCCVLCAVCCALCAVRAVRCVLCAVCRVLCAACCRCCVLCACKACADLPGVPARLRLSHKNPTLGKLQQSLGLNQLISSNYHHSVFSCLPNTQPANVRAPSLHSSGLHKPPPPPTSPLHPALVNTHKLPDLSSHVRLRPRPQQRLPPVSGTPRLWPGES
jgi:hypothetical protein